MQYPSGTIRIVTAVAVYLCLRPSVAVSQASAPVFLQIFKSQKLKLGDQLTLTCRAQGRPIPTISWRRDNEPLTSADPLTIRTQVKSDDVIVSWVHVRVVRVSDSGEYSCTASSKEVDDASSVLHSGRVDLYREPYIRPLPNITATSGHKFTVRCYTSGIPRPTAYWFRGGNAVSVSHRVSVSNLRLTYHSLHTQDAGWYTCGTHAGGRGSRSFYLTVKESPVIDDFSFRAGRKVGDLVSVTCVVSRGDEPVISWLKDGRAISGDLGVIITHTSVYISLLFIKQSRVEHSGNYTCVATNSVATVSYTSQLVVNVPPFWVTPPSDTRVLQNTSVTLTCQSQGSPSPRAFWFKQTEGIDPQYSRINNSPRVVTYGDGTLVIGRAQRADRGSYMCLVVNGISVNISKIVAVSVDLPANTANYSVINTVHRGQPVTLFCHVTGDPPLYVSWSRSGGQKLHSRDNIRIIDMSSESSDWLNSSLTILTTGGRDSGVYLCNSSNAYGQDSRAVDVVILLPPEPPMIRAAARSKTSINLTWTQSYDGGSPFTGYLVHYKHERAHRPVVVRLEPRTLAFTLGRLRCGTGYELCVAGVNSVGEGRCSESLRVRTLGYVAFTPSLTTVGATSVSLNLSVSQHGGCFVSHFTLTYRVWGEVRGDWVDVGVRVKPSNQTIFTVSDLHPSTEYKVKVTAHSEAGRVESDLIFKTTTYVGKALHPNIRIQHSNAGHDVTLIAPITVVCIMILVVAAVVVSFVVVRRRRRRKHSSRGSSGSHDDMVRPSPQSDHSDSYDHKQLGHCETSEDTLSNTTGVDGIPHNGHSQSVRYGAISHAALPYVGHARGADVRNDGYDSHSSPDSDYGDTHEAVPYSYTDVTYPQFAHMFFSPAPPRHNKSQLQKPDRSDMTIQPDLTYTPPPVLRLSYPPTSGPIHSTPIRTLYQSHSTHDAEIILSPVKYATGDTIQAMFTTLPPSNPKAPPTRLSHNQRCDTQTSITTVSSSHEELCRAFSMQLEPHPEPIYHTLLPEMRQENHRSKNTTPYEFMTGSDSEGSGETHEREVCGAMDYTPVCDARGVVSGRRHTSASASNDNCFFDGETSAAKSHANLSRAANGLSDGRKQRPFSDDFRADRGRSAVGTPPYDMSNSVGNDSGYQCRVSRRDDNDNEATPTAPSCLFYAGRGLDNDKRSSILQLEDFSAAYDDGNSSLDSNRNSCFFACEPNRPDNFRPQSPVRSEADSTDDAPSSGTPQSGGGYQDLDMTYDSGIVAFTQTPPDLERCTDVDQGRQVRRQPLAPDYLRLNRNEEVTYGFNTLPNSPQSSSATYDTGQTYDTDNSYSPSNNPIYDDCYKPLYVSVVTDNAPYLDVNSMSDPREITVDGLVSPYHRDYSVV